jgi:hypothetical protein
MPPVRTALKRCGGRGSGRCAELGRAGQPPGLELVDLFGPMIGQPGEDVGEPGLRTDAVKLGGFDRRVDRGGSLATPVRSGEGPVVPAEGHAAQGPLGRVVNGHAACGVAGRWELDQARYGSATGIGAPGARNGGRPS